MTDADLAADLRALDPDTLAAIIDAASPGELAVLSDLLADPATDQAHADRYRLDPAGWCRDVIVWPDDDTHGLTGYQADTLEALTTHGRVAVRGPHGLGKTTTAALAVLWFAVTRDGRDWKVITTASAWRQLTVYLWPEIHKWARLVDWTLVGRGPLRRDELLDRTLKLSTGVASAVASNDPALIEGAHADSILYVFDEAKAIPDGTWDAAEGAFSGAGPDTSMEAFALAISTPAGPVGRFYAIHARQPGVEDWHAIHVTVADAIAAGRVSTAWVDQRRAMWGEASAVYRNRVLGEFAASDSDSVVPLEWVEAAQERWRLTVADGLDPTDPSSDVALTCVGVDVARSGDDATILARRYGPFIATLERHRRDNTMVTTGRVARAVAAGGYAMVDVIGVGAGVVDRLREQGVDVVAYNGAKGVDVTDVSGELGFGNTRSAAWWNLRQLLDPANAPTLALPPDDRLVGDLTSPTWSVTSTGKIKVEPKERVKERTGRSPDEGDAVVMAVWPRALATEPPSGVAVWQERRHISPV